MTGIKKIDRRIVLAYCPGVPSQNAENVPSTGHEHHFPINPDDGLPSRCHCGREPDQEDTMTETTTTKPVPTPGERVTIAGQDYFVTRITVQTKNKSHILDARDKQMLDAGIQVAGEPTRAQIDLMPVAEVERRVANLQALLSGNGGAVDPDA